MTLNNNSLFVIITVVAFALSPFIDSRDCGRPSAKH